MICSNCGRENIDTAQTCVGCGSPLTGGANHGYDQSSTPMFPTAQVATARRLNPFGLIGFVLAIVAFIIGFFPILTWPMWIQVVVWIIWAGALALSIIGLFKVPRGFAIAGVIIAILCMATTSFTVATSGF